jgi:undecaprenyl pyrophosphate synthase
MIANLSLAQNNLLLELLDEYVADVRSGSTSSTYYTTDRGVELTALRLLRDEVNDPDEFAVDFMFSRTDREVLADLVDEYVVGIEKGEISVDSMHEEVLDAGAVSDLLRG